MLAFLATRICSKTQNGKSDIGVQTSEILSHAQKCGTLDTCYPWTFKLRSHSTIALLKCSPHQEKALAWSTNILKSRNILTKERQLQYSVNTVNLWGSCTQTGKSQVYTFQNCQNFTLLISYLTQMFAPQEAHYAMVWYYTKVCEQKSQ